MAHTETALRGWKAIAEKFGCSERKMRAYKDVLDNEGRSREK